MLGSLTYLKVDYVVGDFVRPGIVHKACCVIERLQEDDVNSGSNFET